MSGRPCASCSDPRRPEIDAAIVSGRSFRVIARQFAPLSHDAIRRHRPHVGGALVRAAERKGERFEESLLTKVGRLEADARRLGERAEAEGDLRCALAAVRELLDTVKLLRELMPPPTPTEADNRRVLAWWAEEIGISVEELAAESERIARTRDEILAGRNPPHTEWPAPALAAPPAVAPAPPPPVAPVHADAPART